ncbi:hypothetical protein DV736_g3801, partial [Chaetothyriales sp. CBS 134916]
MLRALQPLRQAAFRNPAVARQSILRQTRAFQTSKTLLRAKEEEHSAHTVTQRLRSLKKIPPELLPLGVVILFALAAATFALGKKLVTDKTLRLERSKGGH